MVKKKTPAPVKPRRRLSTVKKHTVFHSRNATTGVSWKRAATQVVLPLFLDNDSLPDPSTLFSKLTPSGHPCPPFRPLRRCAFLKHFLRLPNSFSSSLRSDSAIPGKDPVLQTTIALLTTPRLMKRSHHSRSQALKSPIRKILGHSMSKILVGRL
jgi:hypothetical protein